MVIAVPRHESVPGTHLLRRMVSCAAFTLALLSGCTSATTVGWSGPTGRYDPHAPAASARDGTQPDAPQGPARPNPVPPVARGPGDRDLGVAPTSADVVGPPGPAGGAPPAVPPASREYPIDLTTALRLAEVENPRIAEARQRVGEALALRQRAGALLLPTLNIGTNYHDHTGNLQRSSGRILNLNEKSLYVGGGAGALAAGTVEVPAVSLFGELTDAIFEPLAARQQVEGARLSASATANGILLEVAEMHFELLAAEADLKVRRESEAQAGEVVRLTRDYALAGQGRDADAERAATELNLLVDEVRKAEEEAAVASVRLAHRLHLDPSVRLRPLAPAVEAVTIVDAGADLPGLITAALRRRPEVGASAAALAAAEVRHRQEQYRPLLPTVALGFSGGGFGGGSNLFQPDLAHFAGRTDFDVRVFWTVRNLGAGNVSLRKRRRAEVGQAVGERSRVIAEVRSEVSAAYAEVAAARAQIGIATRRLSSAEAGFREDLERTRNTVGRPVEVVNSLQLLNQARAARIRAVTDYNKAEFRLFVALGSPPPLGESAGTPLPPAPVATPVLPPYFPAPARGNRPGPRTAPGVTTRTL